MAQALLILGGAAVVSSLLGGGGNSLTISNNISNNLTASAFLNSNTSCFVSSSATNTLRQNESPPANYQGANLATKGGCPSCNEALAEILKKRSDTAQSMGLFPEDTSAFGVPTGTTGDPKQNVSFENPCFAICTEMLVENVSQQQTFDVTGNCNVDNDIVNNMSANIKGSVNSQLSNQEDIFGQLGSIFAGTKDSITTNYANTMTSTVSSNFLQQLTDSTKSQNTISLTGTSIYVNGISQNVTVKSVASLNVTNSVVDQMTQSSDFSLAQSLKNINDTTGDLATSFLNIISSVAGMLDTLVGQVLMLTGAVLLCIMMIVGCLYLFSHAFQASVEARLGMSVTQMTQKMVPNSKLAQLAKDPRVQQMAKDPSVQQIAKDPRVMQIANSLSDQSLEP